MPASIRIPFTLFLHFLNQAIQKAVEDKETVICSSLGIDREKGVYTITGFTETFTVTESALGATYYCYEKDAVIHTHINIPPSPSSIDIKNMKKDNSMVQIQIGRVIRPPNPVFYIIGSIYLKNNEVTFKIAGYSPRFRLEGAKIENKNVKVNISSSAYSSLIGLSRIEYGIVHFTQPKIEEKNEIVIEKILSLDEYYKHGLQISTRTELGYFVTGIDNGLVEPQDYILAYYILALLGKDKATIFKFGKEVCVFEITKTSNAINFFLDGIDDIKVIVGD